MGCKQTADIRSTSALNIEFHAFFSKFREIDFTEKYVCMHYTLTQQFVILGIFFKSLFRFGISYSLTAFHSVTFSSQADTIWKKAKKKYRGITRSGTSCFLKILISQNVS